MTFMPSHRGISEKAAKIALIGVPKSEEGFSFID